MELTLLRINSLFHERQELTGHDCQEEVASCKVTQPLVSTRYGRMSLTSSRQRWEECKSSFTKVENSTPY